MAVWDDGWNRLIDTLEGLAPQDLSRTVTIRREPHSVVAAINRSLTHACYHVGQIVHIARELRGEAWQTLSIPVGASAAHDREMAERFGPV